jgi:hypothetical protein
MRSYLTGICLTDAGQENERRTLRFSGRHDRLPSLTAVIVKGYGMSQAPACFASEEDVSEDESDDEGGAHWAFKTGPKEPNNIFDASSQVASRSQTGR